MTEEINIEARFEEFLRIYQDEKGNYKYRERAKEMAAEGMISLIIDFDDLLRFDPELARILLSEPAQVLSAASNALRNLMQIIDNEYASSVRNFHVRIKNLPTTIPLRKIRSSEIGKLIQIKGILTRASKVKPLLHTGAFKCGSCGAITYKEQEEGRYSPPLICRSCGRKGPFKLLEDESTFIDWQNIRIQERPEELPAGQLPRFIDAIVTEDLVDSARPGDRVTIVGILRSTLDTRTAGKLATFSTYIETVYIEREDKEVEEVYISKEEEKEILEFAKDPFASEKLIASIAPSIYSLSALYLLRKFLYSFGVVLCSCFFNCFLILLQCSFIILSMYLLFWHSFFHNLSLSFLNSSTSSSADKTISFLILSPKSCSCGFSVNSLMSFFFSLISFSIFSFILINYSQLLNLPIPVLICYKIAQGLQKQLYV